MTSEVVFGLCVRIIDAPLIIDSISASAVPIFRSADSSFSSNFPRNDLLDMETKIGNPAFSNFSFLIISISRSAQSEFIFVNGSLFFTSEGCLKKPMAGSTTIFSFEI